jgi:hypothetical protein
MVARQIRIAPDRIAQGRQLYELTRTPVADIATMMGVSRKTLERRVHQWGWVPRSAPRIEAERARVAAPLPEQPAAASGGCDATDNEADLRRANAVRIQKLVAESLDGVSRVLAKIGPAEESGAERGARTLAAVARSLQEMSAMTHPDDETPHDDADTHDDHDDGSIPGDIDEFRRELARRLQGIIAARGS